MHLKTTDMLSAECWDMKAFLHRTVDSGNGHIGATITETRRDWFLQLLRLWDQHCIGQILKKILYEFSKKCWWYPVSDRIPSFTAGAITTETGGTGSQTFLPDLPLWSVDSHSHTSHPCPLHLFDSGLVVSPLGTGGSFEIKTLRTQIRNCGPSTMQFRTPLSSTANRLDFSTAAIGRPRRALSSKFSWLEHGLEAFSHCFAICQNVTDRHSSRRSY